MTVQWTDILVRSTVLGVYVLGEAACASAPPSGETGDGNDSSSSSAQLRAVGEFYQGLWLQVASVLGSLLSNEEDADVTVRGRLASLATA